MKLSHFIVLGEEEKKFTVLHEGVLIGKRANPNFMVFLFQLESYYVETYCNLVSRQIEEYRVFESPDGLAPYLQSISLDGLVNEHQGD